MADPQPTYHAASLPEPREQVASATGLGSPTCPPPEKASLLRMAAGFYGIVIVFALGYAGFSGGIKTLFGEAAPSLGHVLAATAVGLGVIVLTRLGNRLLPWVRRANESMRRLLGPFGRWEAIALALLSGFAEELLFRGALWTHLGIWGTTFLFGLVHVVPRRKLILYPLFAAAVGFVFGLLRSGSESVLPAMLAHALINGVNLVWFAGLPAPGTPPAPPST